MTDRLPPAAAWRELAEGNARFLAYSEGIDANPTWRSNILESAPASGTTEVGGLPWRVYDQRERGDDAGNIRYALATTVGTTDLLVYGTADPAEARRLAGALAASAAQRGLSGTDQAP